MLEKSIDLQWKPTSILPFRETVFIVPNPHSHKPIQYQTIRVFKKLESAGKRNMGEGVMVDYIPNRNQEVVCMDKRKFQKAYNYFCLWSAFHMQHQSVLRVRWHLLSGATSNTRALAAGSQPLKSWGSRLQLLRSKKRDSSDLGYSNTNLILQNTAVWGGPSLPAVRFCHSKSPIQEATQMCFLDGPVYPSPSEYSSRQGMTWQRVWLSSKRLS